jgi:hypothetical protein
MNKTWALGAVVVSALSMAMAACSSSSGGTGGAGGSGATTTVTHSSSSVVSSSSSSGGDLCMMPTGPADCGTACTTANDCETCVVSTTGMGINLFNADVTNECGCVAGSTCASVCSTDPVCTAMPPGTGTPAMACQDCLNNMVMKGDPCIAKLQADCMAQPDCKNFLSNVQPCLSLP